MIVVLLIKDSLNRPIPPSRKTFQAICTNLAGKLPATLDRQHKLIAIYRVLTEVVNLRHCLPLAKAAPGRKLLRTVGIAGEGATRRVEEIRLLVNFVRAARRVPGGALAGGCAGAGGTVFNRLAPV